MFTSEEKSLGEREKNYNFSFYLYSFEWLDFFPTDRINF